MSASVHTKVSFLGLPDGSLQDFLQAARHRDVRAGDRLIETGVMAEGLFLIQRGSVAIVQGGHVLRRLGPGEFFGEGALLRGEAPAVDVVAESDGAVLLVPRAEALAFLDRSPEFAVAFLRGLLAEVTGRLAMTNSLATENRRLVAQLETANTELKDAIAGLAEAHDRVVAEAEERARAEREARQLALFASDSPNPMLRLSIDGTILYANHAADPLLRAWRAKKSMRLPESVRGLVADVAMVGAARDVEWPLRDRSFMLTLVPGTGEATVNLYGYEITALKASEARILHLARHDPLTGLPNRAHFAEVLRRVVDHAVKEGRDGALMFVDLDMFKEVNDTLGHHVGDALLETIARRLTGALGAHAGPDGKVGEAMVARLGGDEFAILLDRSGGDDALRGLASRIVAAVGEPVHIDGHRVQVGASIGVTRFPRDHADPDILLRQADLAMYRAKAAGRNTFCFFADEQALRHRSQVEAAQALRQALERDEFSLLYQPAQSLTTDQTVSVEALVRWNSPQHGLLKADDLLAVAQQAGLLLDIEHWVIDRACHDARSWLERGMRVPVAINLTHVQVADFDLADRMARRIDAAGLDRDMIEVEIPEAVLSADSGRALTLVQSFRAAGLRVTIDDFGSSAFSLSAISRLPVSRLKIASNLTRLVGVDVDAGMQIRLAIALGRSLGISTIAKGVESEAQLEFLKQQRCDGVQGYLIRHPVPGHQLLKTLPGPVAGGQTAKPISA